MTPKAEPRDVLLVEDDPTDVMLMTQAAEGAELLRLKIAASGSEGLSYLRGKARPALVLLDWNLPGKSGADVLREIRADAVLRTLPVLVLTTSECEKDVTAAYRLGANAFLTKPTGMHELRKLVYLIEGFWLAFARLPRSGV